ncbi:MAG: molybdopterin cofactor-binding domain-containing protein [Chloroflexota bacterium]
MTHSNPLPVSIHTSPDLDSWIRIDAADTVTIFTGKVEIGQGIKTALAQIAAEELDVAFERIRMAATATPASPNEGYTAGSNSLEASGNAIRVAATEVRYLLLEMATEALEASTNSLVVEDGTIKDLDSGRQITYWALFGGQQFGLPIQGLGQPKAPEHHSVVGQSIFRSDLVAKVTGQPCFIHDMDVPNMLHGRVIRPPSYQAKLTGIDLTPIEALPDVVKVVRDGSFLGVVASREEQAILAADMLREQTIWHQEKSIPSQDNHFDTMLHHSKAQSRLVVQGTAGMDPIPPPEAPEDAISTHQAVYQRPYHMHAALGPSAGMAEFKNGTLKIWTHNQGPYPLRASIAPILNMNEDDIIVEHVDGAGCYGHNGADDAAFDAALLARAVPNHPVLLKWSRWDEHAWEPYSSAMVIELEASLNKKGQVIDWNHDGWSHTHSGRPRPMADASNLMPAWHLKDAWPPPIPQPGGGYHGGIHRNADPLYAFPKRRVVKHLVPDSPLRVSSMRGLGAYANIFAIESFMDELAQQAGIDPIEFRLQHLADERARKVIQAVSGQAKWQPGKRPNKDGKGRGVAFAQYKNKQCYVASIVDVTVERESGKIILDRVFLAADAGQVVNPDGLINQLEGGFIQSASWKLKEAVRWDANGITSTDWDSYPIMTFAEIPEIETVLINRPDMPFLGSGEGTQGPAPAAIANAVFDAVGIRLREIPFTPQRVKDAL